MKRCTGCGKTRPLSEFNKDKKTKDRLDYRCKECHKEYREDHKEEIKESKKSNYIDHKEKIRDKHKGYYQKNKEEIKETNKDYYHNRGGREKRGYQSMYENKDCASYLGIVIGERLIRHLFNDVEVMPPGNMGFDFICNKGKKIDVKSSTSKTIQNDTSIINNWKFKK